MSNYKMKSLLKGLRYISQIFENEKEAEMQIGTPTDVKHVAHIGWDGGGSVNQNSPSWFRVDIHRRLSEISGRMLHAFLKIRVGHVIHRDFRNRRESVLVELINPKSSRRSKESSHHIPQDGSRKSRWKKSKDSVNGGSSRSSRRARGSQTESISGSVSDAGSISIDDI